MLMFVRRPRLTILMVLVLLASGVGALMTLGRQEDPTLIERFGTVVTQFPGASAERMEALVTEPLEVKIMELAEMGEIRSETRASVSIITIEFRDELGAAEVEQAWTLLREQVDSASADFPAGVLEPDINRFYTGAATMIVAVGWEDGPTRNADADLGIVNRLARDLEDRFRILSGTEETDLFGETSEEIRVQVDADRLAALGLSTADVAAALSAADAKTPAGNLRGDALNLGVEFAGEFDGLNRVRETLLAERGGREIRIADVARVEKGVQSPAEELVIVNGERAVLVAAYLQPKLQVDAWTERARAVVEQFQAELPRGMRADIVFEQAVFVDRRLSGLAANFAQAAVIVFVILFLMMGWRAALIVGTSLPLTVLIVLTLLNFINEPLHQMSVTGLVVALGMLIDNAIVMVDTYRLRRRDGMGAFEAAGDAISRLFAPLLASTLTTCLAFAPIALMPGVAGEFIGMIGVSVIFAVASSFFLAFTVVPALSVWFDREPKADETPSLWAEGVRIPPLSAAFRASVGVVTRVPALGILAGIAIPISGFVLFSTLPLQFFPPTDRDMMQLSMELPPGTPIGNTREEAARASAMFREQEGVEDVVWVVGAAAPLVYYNMYGGQTNQSSFAGGWLTTESPEATRRLAPVLQSEAITSSPSAQLVVAPFAQGPPVIAPVEVKLIGPDFDVLDRLGQEIRVVLSQATNVTYTAASLKLGAPVAKVDADEVAAGLTGRRLGDLANAVRADLDGVLGGSVLEGVEELPVRVILDDAARSSLDAVRAKALPSAGASGLGLPVGALGAVTLEPEIAVITRLDGQRYNDITAQVEPFALPDQSVQDFTERLAAAGLDLPPGYSYSLGGEAEARGEAVGQLFSTVVPLLVLMVAAVVIAFNSFKYAGVVFVVGFLSVGLAFFGVWLFGQPAGFNAIVGAMGLVGLAINGAIVVLTNLRANADACAGDRDAITDVTVDASGHIFATTFTTIGGFTPLLLSGDSFWLPLAAAIGGGVAGSALLALYFTPAVFMLVRDRKPKASTPAKAEPAPA